MLPAITTQPGGTSITPEQEATLDHWVYDEAKDRLVADVTAEFPPGSILIGQTYVSSALEVLAFTTFDDRTMLGIDDPYSMAGSDGLPVRFRLGAQSDLDVNLLSNEVLPDPHTVCYTTFGDNLTANFRFIPHTAGTLRAVFALASDQTKIAFDEKRVVTQDEVDAGLPISFNVGNSYLLAAGVCLLATFSGIQLKGATPTIGPFIGVQLPYYVSQILAYTKEELPTVPYMEQYIDSRITKAMHYKGGYNAATNTPNLVTAPTGVETGWFYTVETAGTFFSKEVEVGDAVIAEINDPTVESDWTILNRHLDAALIKSLYESNLDTNAFTDAEKAAVAANTSKLLSLPTLLQINDTNGYQILTDSSTKTVGKISAADGVQTQITNNGIGGDESNLPSTITEFITTPDGEAVLDQEDGVYSITFRIFTRPSRRDKRYLVEFIAQNGGSPISIFSRNLRFAKDIADEDVSISFSKAATSDIVGLPISVYITPIGASTIVWGQSLSVTKNNAPIA